jgi:hypothetical protein
MISNSCLGLVELRVPRVVADLLFGAPVEPPMLRYPETRDGYGNLTPIGVAVWLVAPISSGGCDWPMGESADPQGPVAVAKRLMFFRWWFRATYLARGGAPL